MAILWENQRLFHHGYPIDLKLIIFFLPLKAPSNKKQNCYQNLKNKLIRFLGGPLFRPPSVFWLNLRDFSMEKVSGFENYVHDRKPFHAFTIQLDH